MRKNPYQYLLDQIIEFCSKLQYAHTVSMWRYPKDKLASSWNLTDLYERTMAAQQLGYKVIIEADERGISVKYVKNAPIPYQWKR